MRGAKEFTLLATRSRLGRFSFQVQDGTEHRHKAPLDSRNFLEVASSKFSTSQRPLIPCDSLSLNVEPVAYRQLGRPNLGRTRSGSPSPPSPPSSLFIQLAVLGYLNVSAFRKCMLKRFVPWAGGWVSLGYGYCRKPSGQPIAIRF